MIYKKDLLTLNFDVVGILQPDQQFVYRGFSGQPTKHIQLHGYIHRGIPVDDGDTGKSTRLQFVGPNRVSRHIFTVLREPSHPSPWTKLLHCRLWLWQLQCLLGPRVLQPSQPPFSQHCLGPFWWLGSSPFLHYKPRYHVLLFIMSTRTQEPLHGSWFSLYKHANFPQI